jgi:Mrr N-terminal domain
LKPAERAWIRAVVKRLILRVGEYAYDPVSKLQLLTMDDFPSIQ